MGRRTYLPNGGVIGEKVRGMGEIKFSVIVRIRTECWLIIKSYI